MTKLLRVAAVAALAFASACAFSLPPIRLDARLADLEVLVGQWSGDYVGDGRLGRRGTISFKLRAGESQAYGDVLMTPNGSRAPLVRRPGEPTPGDWVPSPAESLTIRFVRVEDGFLSGVLDPYWDPDRDCWASTTFLGQVRGRNTIEGTFRSRFDRAVTEGTGRWRVTRQ